MMVPNLMSWVDLIHPVGEYYETSNLEFDPNKIWGGTWQLENDGTVLVSKSNVNGSKFNNSIGTIVGSETHTQTIEELAPHSHSLRLQTESSTQLNYAPARTTGPWAGIVEAGGTGETGGGQPFNIIQPSKIINRWHRIA